MTADELRELQDRGRFFYEMFPGAKAAEEWNRQRDRLDELDRKKRPSQLPETGPSANRDTPP